MSGLVSCKGSDDMSTGRTLQQEYIEEVLEWPHLHGQTKGQWRRDGK